jgi:aryl-alcohol dehydrogenase-like predicted oxidoreductase
VAAQFNLIGPSVEQPQYNLLERNKLEYEFLNIFRTVGMGTTIWSPLASGLLTGKYNNGIPEGSRFALEGFDWLKNQWMVDDKLSKVRKLGEVANELGTSLATLSIAWCVANPNVTTAILGATKKEQITENLKALEVWSKLNAEVLQRIDEIMQTKPKQAEY